MRVAAVSPGGADGEGEASRGEPLAVGAMLMYDNGTRRCVRLGPRQRGLRNAGALHVQNAGTGGDVAASKQI